MEWGGRVKNKFAYMCIHRERLRHPKQTRKQQKKVKKNANKQRKNAVRMLNPSAITVPARSLSIATPQIDTTYDT